MLGGEGGDDDDGTLSVREMSDGSVVATRVHEITDADGNTRTERIVESLKELADGSISVRTLSDEEVEEFIKYHNEDEERKKVTGMDEIAVEGLDIQYHHDVTEEEATPQVLDSSSLPREDQIVE